MLHTILSWLCDFIASRTYNPHNAQQCVVIPGKFRGC